MLRDTILCSDNEEAKAVVDSLGGEHIHDFEYLEDGKVRIILTCKLDAIAEHDAKVTNLDHIAEGLEKLGFEVDKSLLKHLCPPPYDTSFSSEYLKCPKDKECDECYKWWD